MGDVGKGRWTKVGRFLVPKCEVANAIGVSGAHPPPGSLPLVQGVPGGCPKASWAQWYQGLWAIAYLSVRQVCKAGQGFGQGSQGETRAGQIDTLIHTPPPKLHPA
jgi:hypothetical protein